MDKSGWPMWSLGFEFELHVSVLTFPVTFPQKMTGEVQFSAPISQADAAATGLLKELQRSSNIRELKKLYLRKG